MRKSLIKIQDKIQVLSEEEWLDIGLTEPLDKLDFEEWGMDDLSQVPASKWDELDDEFEIITWTDADNPPQIEITVPSFRPLDKLNNQFSIVMGEYEPE